MSSYATTTELFRVLKIRTPTADQVIAAQADLDTATLEINAELDRPDTAPALTTEETELCAGVCLDRAADLWRHRESSPGIVTVLDDIPVTSPSRYSWERYAQRLAILKKRYGFA